MKISDVIEIDGHFYPIIRDATPEEEDADRRQQAEFEAKERQQPATELERIEAQTMYTALLTDTLLEEE